MIEQTLVFIKPTSVKNGHVGEIIHRFERRHIKIKAIKMIKMWDELIDKHYCEHIGKDFFDGLKQSVSNGPIVAMVLEGEKCIYETRKMIGPTDPAEAPPGTIRGDFGVEMPHNVIHASDSRENAVKEISNFFSQAEIMSS